jgi:cell division protein FtsB
MLLFNDNIQQFKLSKLFRKRSRSQQKLKVLITFLFHTISHFFNLEKCIVVQDIFSQVDEALQKRKAENNRLVEEVSDRENQLKYLQQQTKDQSSLNAAQSVSISVSEDNLDKFDQEMTMFYETVLNDAQSSHREFLTDVEES